jgi:hypothetical protein
MGKGGSLPDVKRPGREADHSSPPSTKVKDELSYASALFICLHAGILTSLFILVKIECMQFQIFWSVGTNRLRPSDYFTYRHV